MSCCQCLKIQVLDSITGVPDRYLSGGKLFVDLDSESILEFSKARTELTRIGSIRDEASLPVSLPQSDVNAAIANFLTNHNLIGNQYEPLKVLVQEGAITHNLNYLQFTGSDDTAGRYEATLQRGEGHWLYESEKFKLADAPFDDFELTRDNLISNWQNHSRYDPADGGPGYYFPVVHYGGWASRRSVVVEDLRPWFHLTALLEKSFCAIGWDFESPFFESIYGRRIICYLLSENFLEQPGLLELAKFRASLSDFFIPATGLETVIFDTEDFDNGNNFNLPTSSFSRAGVFNFSAGLAYPFEPNVNSWVRIVKEDQFGVTEVLAEEQGLVDNSGTASVTVKATDVLLIEGDRVYIQFETEIPTGVIGYFENTPLKTFYERGSIFNPAELIDPTLTLLELLKAAVHLCDGRIETDWENRKVKIFSPYDVDLYAETDVEGFFQEDEFEDLTDRVLPRTEVVALARQEKPRYLVLQFKDSNDPKVEAANARRPEAIYSKVIDRGILYTPDKEYSKNPLFEPTVNDFLVKFPTIGVGPVLANNEVDLPHCWDNDDGSISYDIGYRIAYTVGYKQQQTEGGDTRWWVFEHAFENQIPYAFQVPNAHIEGAIPDERMIYGEEDDNDLFSFCYRKYAQQDQYSVQASFQALVSPEDYKTLSFRKVMKMHYGGRTFTSRLLEIDARQSCSGQPATLIVQPITFVGDFCKDGKDLQARPDQCPNYPEMDININLAGNTMSATAQDAAITDPILTDTWEYSIDDGATWQSYTPGTGITATQVIFRRTVSFDADAGECEKVISRAAVFETVCDNEPEIALDYDEGKNIVSATGAGNFNSPIALDTWTVEIDGAAAIPYTEGDPINGFSTVKFNRTVSFSNSCQDVEVSETIEAETPICANSPMLEFVEVSDCVYDLRVTGADSSICAIYYEISRDGGANWYAWDNRPVNGEAGMIARATVMYCDHCPPTYLEENCP